MNKPPPSATSKTVAFVTFLAFVASSVFVHEHASAFSITWAAIFIMLCTASVIMAVSILYEKIYLRKSTGIDLHHKNFSLTRSFYKFIGLIASFGFIILMYWLFPEYHGDFYTNYYQLLGIVLLFCGVFGLPYIMWVDRRMPAPYDGYWHMGKFVTFQWKQVNTSILGQHLLGWLIKGFFLPLMFTYFCDDLNRFISLKFDSLVNFKSYYDFLYDFFYFIDVGLVSMGYIVSLRIADTHLRAAEPTMLGWAAALVCYEPFWSLFGRQYLSYDSGHEWGTVLSDSPVLYTVWGMVILILVWIYVWATISFGARFSNLTHRGIITSGPYRYTKHPAYISKNLSWWLISMPFLVHTSYSESLRQCILLLMLNGIYTLRAKTEERLLSRDPDYVAYVLWIEKSGLLRFLNKVPVLKWLKRPLP